MGLNGFVAGQEGYFAAEGLNEEFGLQNVPQHAIEWYLLVDDRTVLWPVWSSRTDRLGILQTESLDLARARFYSLR
jgi:hypothetical protein